MTPEQAYFRDRVRTFMDDRVRPRMRDYHEKVASEPRWKVLPLIEELKVEARAAGLWNLFKRPSPGHAAADDGFTFEE